MLDLIDEMTSVVEVSLQVNFPRDQKDAKFLACALTTNADYFVTGDHDFEEAKRYGRTVIISVSQFELLVMRKWNKMETGSQTATVRARDWRSAYSGVSKRQTTFYDIGVEDSVTIIGHL